MILELVPANQSYPRCGGHLIAGVDRWGSYLSCLQCGCSVELTRRERKNTATNESRRSRGEVAPVLPGKQGPKGAA